MNGLARLKPILADGGRVRGLGRLAPMAALSLPLLVSTGTPNRRRVISRSSSCTSGAGGDRMDSPQIEGDSTSGNGMSGGIGPTGWRAWSLEQVLVLGGFVSMVLAVVILGAYEPSFAFGLGLGIIPGIIFTGLLFWRPRPWA